MRHLMMTLTTIGLLASSPVAAQDSILEQQKAQLDRLTGQLGADDYGTRQRASKVLQGLARQLIDALHEASRSKDLEVRKRARALLGQISRTARTPAAKIKEWIISMGEINTYRDGTRKMIRERMARAGQEGEDALLDLFVDPRQTEDVRRKIQEILFILRDRPFGELRMTRALGSSSRAVRRYVAFSLGVSGFKKSLPALLRLLPTADGVEFAAVMEAITALGQDQTPAKIKRAVAGRSLGYYERAYVGFSLLYLKDPAGGDMLVEMLGANRYSARSKAWSFLGEIVPDALAHGYGPGQDSARRNKGLEILRTWWKTKRGDLGGDWFLRRRGEMMHVFFRK